MIICLNQQQLEIQVQVNHVFYYDLAMNNLMNHIQQQQELIFVLRLYKQMESKQNYKYGIQQDKSDSEQQQMLIIKVQMAQYQYMIQQIIHLLRIQTVFGQMKQKVMQRKTQKCYFWETRRIQKNKDKQRKMQYRNMQKKKNGFI
ncbi:Ras family protein, putative [Ichthyophthirius multifiliis]|uniref:Ras family protein, putative n=1 Tax=Ichthyophthirius multifiliis TaxID=5932 RepID=G0QP94_ICHMU|nr:Ras family protein, putative [Ichthyophthirius multifiliis]EGR32961.1 Ras family protein, putative [Ichthyophthirius multifiliis]|eukprot:XP_004036947.1 Ras family protein, putative [Ichthyophthirius multifiliis]